MNIDRIKLIKQLGEGRFGIVYLIEYGKDFYSLKIAKDDENFSDIEREGNILKIINENLYDNVYPNFTKLYQMGYMEINGKVQPYIIREYIQGYTLGYCKIVNYEQYHYDILIALIKLENINLKIGDLHSDNILYNEKTGHYMLFDFGNMDYPDEKSEIYERIFLKPFLSLKIKELIDEYRNNHNNMIDDKTREDIFKFVYTKYNSGSYFDLDLIFPTEPKSSRKIIDIIFYDRNVDFKYLLNVFLKYASDELLLV